MTLRYGIPLRKPTGTRMGVWIDSRRAVIVAASPASGGRAAGVKRIAADPQDQARLRGGVRAKACPYGPQTAPADDMRESSGERNLQFFFDDVLAAVRGASGLFIFGPGEAKEKFRKRLEREGLGGRIEGMDSVGRLSDRQIAAKVRDYFRPAE